MCTSEREEDVVVDEDIAATGMAELDDGLEDSCCRAFCNAMRCASFRLLMSRLMTEQHTCTHTIWPVVPT